MKVKVTYIFLPALLLASVTGGQYPGATNRQETANGDWQPWLEALVRYDGYQILLRQAGPEATLDVIRLVESSRSPELVKAIIEVESGWKVGALSQRGARGLMQIRPIAAGEIDPSLEPDDLFDPVLNITLGIEIIESHLDYFADYNETELWALTSYNRGRVGTFALDLHPPDTRYSREVLSHLQQM